MILTTIHIVASCLEFQKYIFEHGTSSPCASVLRLSLSSMQTFSLLSPRIHTNDSEHRHSTVEISRSTDGILFHMTQSTAILSIEKHVQGTTNTYVRGYALCCWCCCVTTNNSQWILHMNQLCRTNWWGNVTSLVTSIGFDVTCCVSQLFCSCNFQMVTPWVTHYPD